MNCICLICKFLIFFSFVFVFVSCLVSFFSFQFQHQYKIKKTHIEYDPNPLQSLGKRTKPKANVDITDPNQPSTSTNVFSLHHESNDQHQTREEKEANK